jgi:hypothetical protein
LITALRLLANDETGNDHLGSDEIVVAFYDQVRRQQMATSVFGDFDTGETREFARGQACITPATDLNPNGARPTGLTRHGDLWRCDRAGAPGPVGVRVVVIEIDDWTPVACNVAIFTTFFTDRGARGSDSAQNTTGCSPDLVGSGFIRFSQGSLLRDLREAGASKEYALRLGGYTLTYRVRRVS